jgi:HNH endonuclease
MGCILSRHGRHHTRDSHRPNARVMPTCLYCRREDRKFTSVEHLVPEGLGNKEIVLPVGVVCDKCNNEVLSQLDKALIEFGPLALLRVKYAVPTKAGKMPEAQLGDALWQRTSPGHVHIKADSKKSIKERPGGFPSVSATAAR